MTGRKLNDRQEERKKINTRGRNYEKKARRSCTTIKNTNSMSLSLCKTWEGIKGRLDSCNTMQTIQIIFPYLCLKTANIKYQVCIQQVNNTSSGSDTRPKIQLQNLYLCNNTVRMPCQHW